MGLFGLFALIFAFRAEESPAVVEEVQIKSEAHPSNEKDVRILCYGDSLTAGMAPPSRKLCPYATSLQNTLDSNSSQYHVDHIGLPGWTTQRFLDKLDEDIGLRHDLSSHDTTDVVILLGGTNDLRGLAHSGDDVTRVILDNLFRLHEIALASGTTHTLALAIPPAGRRLHHPEELKVVEDINSQLYQYAAANEKITFVAFPFEFEQGGPNWSVDGLHLSCQGYDALGKHLAPVVLDIMKKRLF